MGLRLGFGFGPLRISVPLTSRRRRRRKRQRKQHPVTRPHAPAFHGVVRFANGSVYTCHHAHRTQQAANECAAQYMHGLPAPKPLVPRTRTKSDMQPTDHRRERPDNQAERVLAEFVEATFSRLAAVDTSDAAQRFIAYVTRQARDLSSSVPEFYVGEFVNVFKDTVVERARAGIADCEQAGKAAQDEADAAGIELTKRLSAARAAGDRGAEHEVWKEREARQAACQATVDAATRRIDRINLGLDTCKQLAAVLGFHLQ